MANEVEKLNTIAIADIEKLNAKTDDNIEKLNGLEFAGAGAFAVFYGGWTSGGGGVLNVSNLVDDSGGVGSDVTGVGTARHWTAACVYGGDKAIFDYGTVVGSTAVSNLVSNAGVVATDTSGVGTARASLAAVGYSV